MLHCTTFSHWMAGWRGRRRRQSTSPPPPVHTDLHHLAQQPRSTLPDFVRHCPVALKYLELLGELDWSHFPERPGGRAWPGPTPAPHAPFVAAYLVKLEEGKPHFGELRRFLVEHPALVWVLGFPLVPAADTPWGFDVERSLPSRKHLGRVLRELDNAALQFLLTATIQLLADRLPSEAAFGDLVTLDTKHIIAWVRENNPKCSIPHRFDKTHQPKGDPDCKLGCKRRVNQAPAPASACAVPPPATGAAPGAGRSVHHTPSTAGLPASEPLPKLGKGEFYWGYASGVVATKVPDFGEIVLAELTQTFDQSDQSYFLPLMARTTANLGRRPRFGALDAAFDAFYVYGWFHEAGGFAAVPWADRADHRKTFSPEGLPLCAAGLPMPRAGSFWQQSNCLVSHAVASYRCPLAAEATADTCCPVHHENWPKGGCLTRLPTSPGNRIRHELDRHSPDYLAVYRQRTAIERINSQALALGIERPHLRNGDSIANLNTLIYVLINLRTLQRVRTRQASGAAPGPAALLN